MTDWKALSGQLTDDIDGMFATDFAFAPIAEGRIDESRHRLTCFPAILKSHRDLLVGKTRSGGGKEVKFAGRLLHEHWVVDLHERYMPDGEPRQFDVFKQLESQDVYTVDFVERDGSRWLCICWKGHRKK